MDAKTIGPAVECFQGLPIQQRRPVFAQTERGNVGGVADDQGDFPIERTETTRQRQEGIEEITLKNLNAFAETQVSDVATGERNTAVRKISR